MNRFCSRIFFIQFVIKCNVTVQTRPEVKSKLVEEIECNVGKY